MVDKLCRFHYSSPMETTTSVQYQLGFRIGLADGADRFGDGAYDPSSIQLALAARRPADWQLGWSDGFEASIQGPA